MGTRVRNKFTCIIDEPFISFDILLYTFIKILQNKYLCVLTFLFSLYNSDKYEYYI